MRKTSVFITALLCATPVFAAEPPVCDASVKNPCVEIDSSKLPSSLPEHWRTAQMIQSACKTNHCTTQGLADLWMSGSAAPATTKMWRNMHDMINKTAKVTTIIDVDLRQEDHGYLNDMGISLYSKNDWVNLGKTHDEVLQAEENWLNHLSQQKSITLLSKQAIENEDFAATETVPADSIKSEQQVAEANGFKYFRLTVADHMRPTDAEVDRFMDFIKQINSENTWVHFHCHGGDGRTTTFMAMYDMLHNAKQLSFEQIIARQAAVKPFYDLSNYHTDNKEYATLYQQREDFLKIFYLYAQDYLNGDRDNWSTWLQKNKK